MASNLSGTLVAALILTPALVATAAATSDAVGPEPFIDAALLAQTGPGPARALVVFDRAPGPAERAAVAAAGAAWWHTFEIVPVALVTFTPSALDAVAAVPGVTRIEEDIPLAPALQQSRGAVGADQAKRLGVTGRGVGIAVLDTGIDTTHPDMTAAKVVARYDASLPVTVPATVLGVATPSLPEPFGDHGTHVAGIAAGTGAASGARYQGIAPGAHVLDVKVFDLNGEASSSTVLAGIDWVMAQRDALNVRVMVMSLGGRGTDGNDALSRAVDAAAGLGVLTVAAAGNTGPEAQTVGIPGVARRALTVGAVDKRDAIARFSARGPTIDGRDKPDIVAPGVAITSALPFLAGNGERYGPLSGTSMAAPHAAGAAALLFEDNASLTPALAKWILTVTSSPVTGTRGTWDAAYGWGSLDAAAAVRAARDPALLATAAFEALADAVPIDDAVTPLEQLGYQAGRAQRALPAPALLAVVLTLAFVAAARRPR